jgi:hypothetical protein
MSNPIDDALGAWHLSNPAVPTTMRTWFAINPMRTDAAFAVLAKLPNYEARFAAIGSSQRLTQHEKTALYSMNYWLPKGGPR